MTNDSLIDSLRTACFRIEGELVLRFDVAKKIITAMGEWHSADSSLEGTAKSIPCESEAPANTSEICYTIRRDDSGYAAAIERDGYTVLQLQSGTARNEEEIENLVSVLNLRTTEPVSVSLAKCKWEISKVFVPDGIWNIEEGMKMERAAKAVLDAAGVKYEA